jgi:hypothetical protein
MKIKELKEFLDQYPEDEEVFINTNEGDVPLDHDHILRIQFVVHRYKQSSPDGYIVIST